MAAPVTLDDLPRLVRLIKITLGINVALVAVNAAVLYVLAVFLVAEPAAVDGVDPFAEADAQGEEFKSDPRDEMKIFFDRMTDLLDRAARKHGTNPMDVLPTEKSIAEAVETRTMHSDQSEAVMSKLREGFDYYDLTWPAAIPER
ncbi:MAG: hypothetical protein Q8P18_17825 [Pseudomonadota bacterium]|nr:hypothetical protein [Pseudomonadota bacterium]